jgi:hypothetical protein
LVFLFDSFAPAHLALRANLRLLYRAPAPVLGCVYPSYPWFKAILDFRCANDPVTRMLGLFFIGQFLPVFFFV